MKNFPEELLDRLKRFALSVLEIADKLPNTHGARALGYQVSRSAVSLVSKTQLRGNKSY